MEALHPIRSSIGPATFADILGCLVILTDAWITNESAYQKACSAILILHYLL